MLSGCKRIVNGILWEMSELITHNSRMDSRRIFKLGGGPPPSLKILRLSILELWVLTSPMTGGVDHVTRQPLCMTTDQGQKVTRSRNVSAAIML